MPPTSRKQYYAIKCTQTEKFFAGYGWVKTEIFRDSKYWLYDEDVARLKKSTMNNPGGLEIVISPVQDEVAAWGK